MIQYTIRNHGLPGAPVVIRTHSRSVALQWHGRQYRATPRDRGRDYYGLRTLERRAAARVQYGLPGILPDIYY